MEKIKEHQTRLQAWTKFSWEEKVNYHKDLGETLVECKHFESQDFVNNLIDDDEVASMINEELEDLEDDEPDDNWAELIEQEDNVLDQLYKAVSKHLTVPCGISQFKHKIGKKLHNQRLVDWTKNPLISYLVSVVENQQGFGGKQIIHVLKILQSIEEHARWDFFNTIPRNLPELFVKSPINDNGCITLGYFISDPLKHTDVHGAKTASKKTKDNQASRQKYTPHWISKLEIGEDVKLNACNPNKQIYLENGKRRREENRRHAQLILNDIGEVENRNYLALDLESHIAMQIPTIHLFGHFTYVPRCSLPYFPIVSYVGGVLKRFNKATKVTNVLLVQKLIHNGGLEVDNCSSEPVFINKKFAKQKTARHAVVEREENGSWSNSSLNIIKSNDGGLYPVVIAEGIELVLLAPSTNEYYAVFDEPDEPSGITKWILTVDCEKFEYSDCNLILDEGKQVNKAVTRADYPGNIDAVRWNKVYFQNGTNGSVLNNFKWATIFREVFHGTTSALNPEATFIRAKYLTLWKDDYTPHTTTNYNQGTSIYAYRMNDEPNNRPHVFGIKFSHAGSKIMWNAIEHEFLTYINGGIVVQEYDVKTGRVRSIWEVAYPWVIGADRMAAMKFLLQTGANGKHPLPRLIGKKCDLSPSGKHSHYSSAFLPHCSMLKTHGFMECVHAAVSQTTQKSHKRHLRTAAGMAHYYDKVSPLTVLFNQLYQYHCDGFHSIFGGSGKDIAKSIHSIETQEDPLLVQLFTRLYNAGTSVAPYQYRSPISCFLAGKLPNKFTLIYNAVFLMLEMQPLLSVQSHYIHEFDDSVYIRCVQDFWLAINYWVCAVGRLHSSCANSRQFQYYHIQPIYVQFMDWLNQIVNVLEGEIKYIEQQQVRNDDESNDISVDDIVGEVNAVFDKSNPVGVEITNDVTVKTESKSQDEADSDTDLGSDEVYIPGKDDYDDEEVSMDGIVVADNDDDDQDNMGDNGVDINSVCDTNLALSEADQILIKKYKSLQKEICDIKDKSNVYLMMEMLNVDGYAAPMLVGDCGNFETGLREPKKSWTKGDKRFDEITNVKQLEKLKRKRIWDDWWAKGMPNHNQKQQEFWCQFMPLPIKSCMLCMLVSVICGIFLCCDVW